LPISYYQAMSPPFKLVFVTGNAYKLREVRSVLCDAVDLESVDLELPEIQGTAVEIAQDKCRRAAEVVSVHKRSPRYDNEW
jgi:inosine triphosphate pyrophosphatase